MESIKWVHELGCDNVDFELDSKSVVDNVNCLKPIDSDFGDVTRECN